MGGVWTSLWGPRAPGPACGLSSLLPQPGSCGDVLGVPRGWAEGSLFPWSPGASMERTGQLRLHFWKPRESGKQEPWASDGEWGAFSCCNSVLSCQREEAAAGSGRVVT